MIDQQNQLNLQGSLGANRVDTQRSIDLPGINQQAKASYTQWNAHIGAELQRSYQLAESTHFEPAISLDYSRVHEPSHREQGAGAQNLRISGDHSDELLLGMAGTMRQAINPQWNLQAQLGAYYDLLDNDQQVTASFVGGGGQFVTRGIDNARWRSRAGLALHGETASGLELTARYDYEWRNSFRQQSLSVQLRKPF